MCAFSPHYSIPRIATAVEIFLNGYRSKSADQLVVLAAHAIEIETLIRKRVKERNEIFDSFLTFVEGLPNSVPGLQVMNSSPLLSYYDFLECRCMSCTMYCNNW